MPHTLGCAMMIAKQTASMIAVPISVCVTPICAETGPAIAEPSGMRTNEPSASYEDTLTVFELANLQLLELRTYDAFLDKVVDKAYDDLEDLFARSSLLRSGHDTVKELAEVRMDLAEASFQVDNISKLWGDWFLGKVYRACAKKFELDSWRRNVEEKMKDLSEIYEVAEAELEARRLLILEFLVVLLFIVDLVLIAYRG